MGRIYIRNSHIKVDHTTAQKIYMLVLTFMKAPRAVKTFSLLVITLESSNSVH
jgi:hypothetical protein